MELPKDDGERISSRGPDNWYTGFIYERLAFAYRHAAGLLSKTDRVLEIGCADGYGSKVLAETAGSVTGIDNSPEAVAVARARHGGGNIEFVVGRGEDLPFPDASFDKAVAFHVIEHIESDAAFLAGVSRVLKPGGSLILSTPNRVHRLKPGERPWFKYHVREYGRDDLGSILAPHFSRVDVKYINGPAAAFEVEKRVARTAALARKVDFLDLADRVPFFVRKGIVSLLSLLPSGEGSAPPPVKPEDFSVSAEDITGLDLLAVCVK